MLRAMVPSSTSVGSEQWFPVPLQSGVEWFLRAMVPSSTSVGYAQSGVERFLTAVVPQSEVVSAGTCTGGSKAARLPSSGGKSFENSVMAAEFHVGLDKKITTRNI